MGYYVRKLGQKKKAPQWKIQYVSYKKKDQRKHNQAKIPKRTWDISKDRWPSLGFHCSLNFKEAQARARQLNAQLHLKRQVQNLLNWPRVISPIGPPRRILCTSLSTFTLQRTSLIFPTKIGQ